jgi:hypothetical protein
MNNGKNALNQHPRRQSWRLPAESFSPTSAPSYYYNILRDIGIFPRVISRKMM